MRAARIDSAARPYVEASRGMLLVRTGRPDDALHHFDLAIADLTKCGDLAQAAGNDAASADYRGRTQSM